MTHEEIKLLELLKFTVNQKAVQASGLMNTGFVEIDNFWKGQYMAFNEVYSLLKNITDSELLKCDVCGCTPTVITKTDRGTFCKDHIKY